MLTSAYTHLMKCATPVLEVYLKHRARKGKEDPARAHERRGNPLKIRNPGPLVWFHAASVGESQSLLILIDRLLKNHHNLQVMVTTGTVTSARLMQQRLPEGAFHQYMPVDHPEWTERFLAHWKPELAIWAESEFWPNILSGLRRRRIPAVLLNARMSETSFRFWHLAKGLIADMLGTFQLCLSQNAVEAKRLAALGAFNVHVAGNLKYAAAPLPCDAARLDEIKKAVDDRPCLLWASTHPGEEDIACRVHSALQKKFPHLLTIIVPRHPQRGGDVSLLAGTSGLKNSLRSHGHVPDSACQIYIADTLGELGLFYRLCRVCIIGGSFVPVGGHNPIEPAQLGCQIFYGPHMFNFVSICEDFESRQAAMPAPDEAALVESLRRALQEPENFSAMAQTAQDWTQRQAHVVDETVAWLDPFINKIMLPQKAGAA